MPAGELEAGDEFSTHTGSWVKLDAIHWTGEYNIVYNFRVAEDHTYFVGKSNWGFSVWVHNTYDTNKIGRIGELVAVDRLEERGWTVIESLHHGRNGIDVVAQKQFGSRLRTIVVEVKVNSSKTSLLQRRGAVGYAQNVINRLVGRENLTPGARAAARLLQREINAGTLRGAVYRLRWNGGKVVERFKLWEPGVR